MRDKWYGDNRDLVKWGALVALAEQHGAETILQILYYRPTMWSEIYLNGEQVDLPTPVIRHFRQCAAAAAIQVGAHVEILDAPFVDRAEYQQLVIESVRSIQKHPSIIVLDPDTGLEPRRPSLDHVLESEVAEVWAQLADGDILAVYQHQTNRNGRPWVDAKKGQFERAIAVTDGLAGVARSEAIARDVVLFYAQKPANNGLHRTRAARR